MKILSYITKSNNILIDPNITINSGVTNGYTVCFKFQIPWSTNLKLYAVFKPVNDVPVKLELNENLECVIPAQLYKRYSKLGIGLRGEHKQGSAVIEEQATNLFYVPISYSGI